MGRIARIVGPASPHHVTQRGNRRMDTFFGDDDNRAYLPWLAEWFGRQETRIRAYSLMPDHVHPEKAGLVERAEDWPWSSAAAHAAGRRDAVAEGAWLADRTAG